MKTYAALQGVYDSPEIHRADICLHKPVLVVLRNDSDPGLATKSVIAGGVFNIFGDYFCVFTLDMGIRGAGIATAMGAGISTLVMLTHFSRRATLCACNFQKKYSASSAG